MWASGQPFRIVLPVLAQSGRRIDAELVWLTTIIDPAHDTDLPYYPTNEVPPWERYDGDDGRGGNEREAIWRGLRTLRTASRPWRVAQLAFGRAGFEAGGWCPVIVRVTGSPLMVLPPITGSLREEMLELLGYAAEENLTMTHALTIDEYTSARQSEHELYFSARGEERALPSPLSLGTGDLERVWVGFGVQVDDPAIRMRMFTQLSAASMVKRQSYHSRSGAEADRSETNVSPIPPGEALRIRGLAVNRRLDENQSTSLQWLGFQFAVDDSVAKLIPDIEHCGKHYEQIADTLRDLVANGPPRTDGHLIDIDWGRPPNDSCRMWTHDQPSGGRRRR
jgi:hypothetical protein